MRNSGILHLIIAVALAIASVLWYVGGDDEKGALILPTEYASDVYTKWETLPDDSLAIKFSGVDVLGDEFSVVWRAGELEGDADGIALWKEEPGEMAKRWRGGLDEKVKLEKTNWGWQLVHGDDVVVWADAKDALIIPPAIAEKGAGDIQFPDAESSDELIRYTAFVNVPGGKYLAQTRGSRTLWVYSGNSSQQAVVSTETVVSAPARNATSMGVVRNHRSGGDMDILWNEELMTVEAVGTDGTVVWSKEVESAPIGKAYEVDIYANRKYQAAFATSNAVHLIDVKGRSVRGFPYKPASNVSGFCVVDYDNNKKFRFLVATTDGAVTNLKGEAKRTSGWNFSKLGSGQYVRHLAHLRVGSKDYVYAGCNNGMVLLLKRTGAIRTSTDVQVFAGSAPAFRLSSSIGNSSVLFIDADGWLEELKFQDATQVGMSKLTRADRVESIDVNGDGKKEIVVHHNGKRLIWNSRNEIISE